MALWIKWMKIVAQLRPACSRMRGFLWLVAALAGFCVRPDLLGVSSIMRGLGLAEVCYDRVLDFFHSKGIKPDRLAKVWTVVVLRYFSSVMKFNGRLVLVGDGIKVAKAGRKMPGVKLLHQESDNNTKPEFIMGHSCQAVALVVGAEHSAFAVPLATRIHEGTVFSNRCKKKLPDKMVSLLGMTGIAVPFYFVADAYYACQSVIFGMDPNNGHLVSRVRNNAVGYHQAPPPKKRKRGRPKLYGKKCKIISLFDHNEMVLAKSPVYGETDIMIRYRHLDLLWRPTGTMIRFVAVDHPTRGRIILMTTDLTLAPVDVIGLYGVRFKIEVSFKQALRTVGAFAYHFWMKKMKPIRRHSGNQYLHRETEDYRNAARRKLDAYHRHIQIGLIAQGLLQYLSVTCPALVWRNFGSWIRTIRPGIPPSEMVTAQALRSSLPEFLVGTSHDSAFTKFLLERVDVDRAEGLRLTG
jgi:hypothetical protein